MAVTIGSCLPSAVIPSAAIAPIRALSQVLVSDEAVLGQEHLLENDLY